MNKDQKQKPQAEPKPELFKVRKNYCYLTGAPADRPITRKTPIHQTTKITQQR